MRNYAKASATEVSSILEERIRGVADESSLGESGKILSVGYVLLNKKKKYNNIQSVNS